MNITMVINTQKSYSKNSRSRPRRSRWTSARPGAPTRGEGKSWWSSGPERRRRYTRNITIELLLFNSCYHYLVIFISSILHYITCGYIIDSLISESDKGSHGGQKKSYIESNVTLQIFSTVDSTGKNIGARKWGPHNVTTIVRNGRFVRSDHRSAVTTR